MKEERIMELAGDVLQELYHPPGTAEHRVAVLSNIIRSAVNEAMDETLLLAIKAARDAGEKYSTSAGNVYARHSGRAAASRIIEAIRALKVKGER